MCVTFVVFTDCENCTRPISTRLTHGACFVARRLELVGVAGLMWVSWCVLGGADFFVFFSDFFFFERTRPTASMRPPLASFTSLLLPVVFTGRAACVTMAWMVGFTVAWCTSAFFPEMYTAAAVLHWLGCVRFRSAPPPGRFREILLGITFLPFLLLTELA